MHQLLECNHALFPAIRMDDLENIQPGQIGLGVTEGFEPASVCVKYPAVRVNALNQVTGLGKQVVASRFGCFLLGEISPGHDHDISLGMRQYGARDLCPELFAVKALMHPFEFVPARFHHFPDALLGGLGRELAVRLA